MGRGGGGTFRKRKNNNRKKVAGSTYIYAKYEVARGPGGLQSKQRGGLRARLRCKKEICYKSSGGGSRKKKGPRLSRREGVGGIHRSEGRSPRL